jgi:hypothetical protein
MAEHVLETLGTPQYPAPEAVEKIAEHAAERERAIAW